MIVCFDETQEMLRDAARGVCGPDAGATKPLADRQQLWRRFAELGWTGVVLPEGFGGSEGSLVDAGIIAMEMGRGGLFYAYPETVALSFALARSAAAATPAVKKLLDGVAQGSMGLSLPLNLDPSDPIGPLRAAHGDGISDRSILIEPGAADTVLVTLMEDAEPRLVAIPTTDAASRPLQAVTRSKDRLVDLRASAAKQNGTALLRGAAAAATWEQARTAYRCLACAQLLGAGRQFLDMAVDYAGVRSQFGRLIGSFQAVQHAIVETLAAADAAELLTFKALRAIDGGAGCDDAVVASAISFTREAIWTVLMKSYDVLGGVGYMEEHPLSRYTRSLLPVLASLGPADVCDEQAGLAIRKGGYLS